LEATRRIRADARWRDLAIIAMTAHAMSGDRERCLAAGMNAYLSKPVSSQQLYQLLEQLASGQTFTRPAAPPANSEPSPIDPRLNDELREADPDLMAGVLDLFLQLAPERMGNMQKALLEGNCELVAVEAGLMSQSAERIAANPVAQRARRVADAAERRDQAGMRNSLLLLRSELERLRRHIGEERTMNAG
jgi:response regulator RpfG family c-di-GMP phosphodiesterase